MEYVGIFLVGFVVGAVSLAVACLAIAKNYKNNK